MERARVIYNPSSGREEGRRRLADILNALEGTGYEASAFATTKAGDATKEAARVSEDGVELIVAVGGDGTVYEVINGMAEKEKRPKLAIIPLGTTNDAARALKIPKNIDKTLEIIKKGHSISMDIGKVNDKYFINIAGGGSLTELTYEVPSKMKTAMGQLAYYLKGVEKMAKFRPFRAKIKVGEETYKEDIMMFMVANTNSVGGFNKFAPSADYSDGLFDVIILKRCNIAEFGHVMSKLLQGEHINHSKIIHFKTDNFYIKSRGIGLNLDGEYGGKLPAQFSMLKNHIDVITCGNE